MKLRQIIAAAMAAAFVLVAAAVPVSAATSSSVIQIDDKKVTLDVGDSQTVTITVPGAKSLSLLTYRKSVCSAKFDSFDGKTAKLTITAKAAGTTTVRVYLKEDKSVYNDIAVDVNGPVYYRYYTYPYYNRYYYTAPYYYVNNNNQRVYAYYNTTSTLPYTYYYGDYYYYHPNYYYGYRYINPVVITK